MDVFSLQMGTQAVTQYNQSISTSLFRLDWDWKWCLASFWKCIQRDGRVTSTNILKDPSSFSLSHFQTTTAYTLSTGCSSKWHGSYAYWLSFLPRLLSHGWTQTLFCVSILLLSLKTVRAVCAHLYDNPTVSIKILWFIPVRLNPDSSVFTSRSSK